MQLHNTITQIVATVTIIIIVLIGVQRLDMFLKNQAIDSCLKVGSYSSEIGGTSGKNISLEPIKSWYDFCMKEKGYK